ncbi:protein of unknown function [Petrocella atlantisensis]|uniref:SEC-C motif-containing protein n=1 Tax=Petrocella atlantisensis TaxID=2173034 RepID=A0A3P7NZJ9_9FIRM|nr:SEC-C metal-binding domain-containing protein [Petrocella atlantisensis]VDN48365.1 protein of unknown function [Petrocella atlantisensis]
MKYEINCSKYVGIEPEPVNAEFIKLDIMMQEGYGYELNGDSHKAVTCWKDAFDELTAYFEENHLCDLKSFDDIFNGTQYIRNWVQDYDDSLRNVLLDADEESKEKIGMLKIELLGFLISLNVENDLNIHNLKRSLAETYYLMGQPEVGEQHFIQLIDDYPDNEWGYIGYSDEYWMGYSKYKDFDKAFKILNKAYNRLSIIESDIIAERLTDLMIVKKKMELENFNATEAFRNWTQFNDERPIIPEYAVLYQQLFDAREERLGKPKGKVAANDGFNQQPLVKEKKIGRNEPCPCGSGKKYKKCCGK